MQWPAGSVNRTNKEGPLGQGVSFVSSEQRHAIRRRIIRASCVASTPTCRVGELGAAGVDSPHFSFQADTGAPVHVLGVDHLERQYDLGPFLNFIAAS